MKILCKYPTRGRPTHFLARLREWTAQAADPSKIAWLVSYDADDVSMTPEVIKQAEAVHPSVVCVKGNSKSKIAACNADINEYGADWDIILLVSDDMYCRRQDWDEMIRRKMAENYPDTDGCLWIHDGTKQRDICTLSCMGRKYYERERYIYHPSYFSFFCDNEYTDIARQRDKMVFIEHPIASHEHPAWNGGMQRDATYQRNNKYWASDQATYNARKAAGFPK